MLEVQVSTRASSCYHHRGVPRGVPFQTEMTKWFVAQIIVDIDITKFLQAHTRYIPSGSWGEGEGVFLHALLILAVNHGSSGSNRARLLVLNTGCLYLACHVCLAICIQLIQDMLPAVTMLGLPDVRIVFWLLLRTYRKVRGISPPHCVALSL